MSRLVTGHQSLDSFFTLVKINIEKLFEKKTSAREFLEGRFFKIIYLKITHHKSKILKYLFNFVEKLVVVEKKDEFESIDDLEKMLTKLKTQVSGGKKCIKVRRDF